MTPGDANTALVHSLVDQLRKEIGSTLAGMQIQIEAVDQQQRRQYDILNKTLMALIQRDNEEYVKEKAAREAGQAARVAEVEAARIERSAERAEHATDLAEIRKDQRVSRYVQVATLIVVVIALALWIGARFL